MKANTTRTNITKVMMFIWLPPLSYSSDIFITFSNFFLPRTFSFISIFLAPEEGLFSKQNIGQFVYIYFFVYFFVALP